MKLPSTYNPVRWWKNRRTAKTLHEATKAIAERNGWKLVDWEVDYLRYRLGIYFTIWVPGRERKFQYGMLVDPMTFKGAKHVEEYAVKLGQMVEGRIKGRSPGQFGIFN